MPTTSNNACDPKLRQEIDRQFPRGHAVAVADGAIVADAPSLRELAQKLTVMGKTSKSVTVLEAGVDPLETQWILGFRESLAARPAWQRLLLSPFVVTAAFVWAFPILHVFALAILVASASFKLAGWIEVTSLEIVAWTCSPYAVILIAALAVMPCAAVQFWSRKLHFRSNSAESAG